MNKKMVETRIAVGAGGFSRHLNFLIVQKFSSFF